MKTIRDMLFGKAYRIGQGVVLSGGYDMEPNWLQGEKRRYANIVKEIPGQNESPALVVQFEKPFEVDGYAATYAVLELRYVGATWRSAETCHIEICDFLPEEKSWKERKQGKWVESHATFTLDIR